MTFKIGYLAPEFPGQTHLFLWREIQALEELGIELELISTRQPPSAIMSHDWAEEALARTTYLLPFRISDGPTVVTELLRAGPLRLVRCLKIALTAPHCSIKERLRLLALILPSAKLAGILRRKKLEHIHVPSCANSAHLAMFASILTAIPYSLSLLGPTLEEYGPNQENKWRHAAFVVVMSKLLYDVATRRLRNFLPPIVEIGPVGVDLDRMKRTAAYTPLSPGQKCLIYSCGRLNPVKAHDDLIDAVAMLRERNIDCELTIAGEDEQGGTGYRRDLERHIAQRNAGAFVTLLGAISETEHRARLDKAHLFTLASLNEGISVAIMEAMAMQTPVVVTDVGGNSELVESGVNGILVQPKAPKDMADAMEKVLRDSELAVALSEESRQTVAEKFDSRAGARTVAACIERSRKRHGLFDTIKAASI